MLQHPDVVGVLVRDRQAALHRAAQPRPARPLRSRWRWLPKRRRTPGDDLTLAA